MEVKFEKAMDCLDSILGYSKPLYGYRLENFINDKIYNLNKRLDNKASKLHCTSGASKIVVWHDDWDFVLKFNKYCASAEDLNYCALEYANFLEMQRRGIGELCAWVKRLGRIGKYTIYAQEKLHVDSDAVDDSIDEIRYQNWLDCYAPEEMDNFDTASDEDKYKFFWRTYSRPAPDWYDIESLMSEYWTNEQMEKLGDVIDDLHINDIHSGNVGYRDNRMVLLDYSGYSLEGYFHKNGYTIFKKAANAR